MAGQKSETAAAPRTKMEAVKRTLQERGRDLKPLAIKEHVKRRYGIEISAAVASDYKKKLLKQAKAAATPQAATPAVASQAAAPPAPKASAPVKKASSPAKGTAAPKRQAPAARPQKKAAEDAHRGGSILLEDVLTVKALLDRVGADRLPHPHRRPGQVVYRPRRRLRPSRSGRPCAGGRARLLSPPRVAPCPSKSLLVTPGTVPPLPFRPASTPSLNSVPRRGASEPLRGVHGGSAFGRGRRCGGGRRDAAREGVRDVAAPVQPPHRLGGRPCRLLLFKAGFEMPMGLPLKRDAFGRRNAHGCATAVGSLGEERPTKPPADPRQKGPSHRLLARPQGPRRLHQQRPRG